MCPFGSQCGSIFNRHRNSSYYGQALTGSKEKWGALETGLHLGTPPATREKIEKRWSPRIDFSRNEILPAPIPPGAHANAARLIADKRPAEAAKLNQQARTRLDRA